MPITVEREKWILYKHTSNYEMVKAVALDVKNNCRQDVSPEERHRMQERLAALDLYRTRNPENRPLDSIGHRINTLEYYMFGYEYKDENNNKKFIFSPLGNLFLKHINEPEKLQKIFITMLFAIQFEHPGSGTPRDFQLFPFRLIFQLLLDPRLSGKLYNYEVEYLVVFEKEMTPELYERLVAKILELRHKTNSEIANMFMADEHTYVNAVYEWEYYTTTLLAQVGIFEKHDGDEICRLCHPRKSGSRSPQTCRRATDGYVTINENLISFVARIAEEYSLYEKPIKLNDPERLYLDCVKEVYSFYPELLLQSIGEEEHLSALLQLPKLIEEYANNQNNETAYLFEEVLTRGFDMFSNVRTVRRGGAAHTDIECLYVTRNKKFAVEAKSTANKLLGINAGRLREHREEIGGEYTIVVTPRYVPATRQDIQGTPIVIILASTLAEYLYNNIFHDVRDIDYADFDDIIMQNLGKDVSKQISDMTLDRFASTSC